MANILKWLSLDWSLSERRSQMQGPRVYDYLMNETYLKGLVTNVYTGVSAWFFNLFGNAMNNRVLKSE